MRAGKTTACKYIGEKYSAVVFRNSQVLVEIAERLNFNASRVNLSQIGMALFDTFGRDLIARHWTEQIRKGGTESKLIVIDGLRFPDEVVYYQQNCKFTLVAIVAPDDQRFIRSQSASDCQKDQSLDMKSFLEQSESVNESYTADLIGNSQAIIENDKTVSDLYAKLDEVVASLS